MLHKQSIIDALLKVDQNILKLDSGLDTTIAALNQPVNPISVKELVRQLQQFKGKVIIQSLFTRGNVGNKYIDNTTASDLDSWIGCLNQIQPEMVMIYTIDRDTPYEGLKKVPLTELKAIAHRVNLLGIKTQVKG
jgi:wyosine [tRNA(Phe)-imidazoG37] synthetase (radical SAM superfamily)